MSRGEPLRAHAIIRQVVRARSSMAGEDPEMLLELLLHTLPAHFALEERAGGLYERLRAAGAPSERIEALCSDHQDFVEALARLQSETVRDATWARALWQLAERLREHEWLEAALALQGGVELPTDEVQPLPPSMVPPEVRAAALRLGQRARALATEVPGRLLAEITLRIPQATAASQWQAAAEEELSRLGLPFVGVNTCWGPGEADLEGCRFVACSELPLTEGRGRLGSAR
jgi:hypothetical protein